MPSVKVCAWRKRRSGWGVCWDMTFDLMVNGEVPRKHFSIQKTTYAEKEVRRTDSSRIKINC